MMNVNIVLSVTIISMGLVAFAVAKLGDSYFSAVSRNPVAGEQLKTMALIFASMTELLGLVMMAISLFLAFTK